MTAPIPRVQVPSQVAKGEVFQVRSLIAHRMETGLRHDEQGNVIPRKLINKFTCRYNGTEVFSAALHEAVSANPYFEFYLRATESGRLQFAWLDDGGEIYRLETPLAVV